jgi:hypothetical protein
MATRILINNLQAEDVFLQTQIDELVAAGSLAGVAAKVKVGATTAMLSVDNTDPVIPKIDINVALPVVNGAVLIGNTNGSLSFSSEAPILNVASSTFIDVIENPANIPPVPTDIQIKLAVGEPASSGQVLRTSLEGILTWEDRVQTILPKAAFGITPFLSVDSTDPLEPVIDLNVGLPAVSGMSLNANTDGTLFWEERLQSITANQQPLQTATYLTINKADPENNLIDLNVGLPASNGQVLSALTNGTLSWITDTGAGVESIVAKQQSPTAIPFLSVDSTNPAIPEIDLNVDLPASNGAVLASLTNGDLFWKTGGEVVSIDANTQSGAATTFLLVNSINPAIPTIDLNVGLPASNGQVLSALTNGTLSWITDTGSGVESISPKQIAPSTIPYLSVDSTNPAIPIIGLDVGLPSINNQVLTAQTTGALSWSFPALKQVALTEAQQVAVIYQYVLGSNAPNANQRISNGSLNIDALVGAYGDGRLKVSGSICLRVLTNSSIDADFFIGNNATSNYIPVMPFVYNTTSGQNNHYINVSFNSIYDNNGTGSLYNVLFQNADLYVNISASSPPSGNMFQILYRSLQIEWLPLANA